MDTHFQSLELLAKQPFSDNVQEVLTSQTPQYEDAPLEEIFELLESAVETYNVLAPTLSQRLRESAEQEIEFFYSLTQKRLGTLVNPPRLMALHSHLVAA